MKKVSPRFLLYSLLLHGLLLVLLLGLLKEKRELAPAPAVYVDLPPSSGAGAESGAATTAKAPPRGGGKKRARIARGKPAPFRWKTSPFAWEEGGGGAGPNIGPGHGDAPPARKGKGAEVEALAGTLDVKEEAKFYGFADKIWKRIDSHLEYPVDFIEDNQEAEVLLHITVGPDGRFTGSFLEIEDNNPLLRTYVMAIVAFALKEPLEPIPKTELKEIALALRFHFELKMPDDFKDPRRETHFKNTLHFDRVAFTEPKFTKDARQFLVNYMPPIIPVPGGFFIDFVALYKQLQEKQDRDPRWKRGFRMEMDQELWRAMLPKKEDARAM